MELVVSSSFLFEFGAAIAAVKDPSTLVIHRIGYGRGRL